MKELKPNSNAKLKDFDLADDGSDIFLLKEKIAALEQEREFLKQVIDTNPNLIFSKDRAGRFTLVNKAVADLYGTTVAQLLGKTDADFNLNAAEVEHFRQDDLMVMDHLCEKIIPEELVTNSEGQTRCFQTVKRPIINADGSANNILGVSTDITERKRAESALRKVAEVISTGTGQELFVSVVNHLTQFLGVRYAFISKFDKDCPLVRTLAFSEDGSVIDNIDYSLEGSPSEKVASGEFRCLDRDVRAKFPKDETLAGYDVESYCGVPLFSSSGSAIGVMVVLDTQPFLNKERVISVLQIFAARVAAELERIRAEEDKDHLETQLRHVQKLESLGVLAGGIAHDFNNLLMGVLGNASLALGLVPEDSPVKGRIVNIQSAAERAAVLTNQLLAYSGKAPVKVAPLDLSSLMIEMGSLLETVISKGARIEYSLNDSVPAVNADAAQMQQVLMNLMTNASDAIGKGSGTIRVSIDVVEVNDLAPRDSFFGEPLVLGSYVCLAVEDNGCGMGEEEMAKIFDPFFSTKFTGRGLGMAAVLGIIRAHRGSIEIDSELGQGTTFRVFLPICLEPLTGKVEAGSTERNYSGLVLIVDDEESVCEVAEGMLSQIGFKTIAFRDGFDAIDWYNQNYKIVDLVLLDLTMPRINGDKVFEALRQTNSEVPIILSSGYAESDVRSAVFSGSMEFIQKPFGLSQLVEAISEILDP